MSYQQTSLLAYQNDVLPKLSDRQQAVYEIIQRRSGLDNKRIAQILGWPINSVTPRVLELRTKGLVKESFNSRKKLPGERAAMRWEAV